MVFLCLVYRSRRSWSKVKVAELAAQRMAPYGQAIKLNLQAAPSGSHIAGQQTSMHTATRGLTVTSRRKVEVVTMDLVISDSILHYFHTMRMYDMYI